MPPAASSRKRYPYHQWAPDARALNLVGDKWTLLIVRDLSPGPRRFTELQRVLPGISTEQLRSRLNRMVADGLLARQCYPEVPPRVEYELTARSRQLLPVLGALARWGYDWVWTAPQESEAIDIGAILRVAPGLVHPPSSMNGIAAFIVHVDITTWLSMEMKSTTSYYTLTVQGGAVAITECKAEDADVRVSGWEGDWIAALGPSGDLSALQIEGDERLASVLLAGTGTGDGGGGGGVPIAQPEVSA